MNPAEIAKPSTATTTKGSMRVAICYPLPCDNETFRPDVERFARTFMEFFPSEDWELNVVLSHYKQGQRLDLDGLLGGLNEYVSDYISYTGHGADLGSHQHAAHTIDADLAIFCSTRVHFHRAGWMERIVQAWQQNGPGLYAAMGSFERAPHLRTCLYATSPALFREFPHLIQSREDTLKTETGEWNLTRWFQERGLPASMVTWTECVSLAHCRKPANIFRRGTQSNILAWDRHTQIYAEANLVEQQRLAALADGIHR